MIGRVCIKLTGREAGEHCVIVNNLDDSFVLIDGNIKRRKCNINHLEFTDKVLNIKKDASTKEVLEAMSKENIKVIKLKEAKKEIKEKPNKKRKSKNLGNESEDNKANKNVKTKK